MILLAIPLSSFRDLIIIDPQKNYQDRHVCSSTGQLRRTLRDNGAQVWRSQADTSCTMNKKIPYHERWKVNLPKGSSGDWAVEHFEVDEASALVGSPEIEGYPLRERRY